MANSFQSERDTPEYATIAELAENLVIRLPGCDDEIIRRSLREAYVEFCRVANALVTTREIALEANETDYPVVNMVPDCRVECVRAVFMRGHALREGVDYSISAGIPPVMSVRKRLLPPADRCAEVSLAVQCLEIPNSGSERAPRWFIRKYGDAVCAGALARLLSMGGRPWSDMTSARIEVGRWDGYVTSAKIGSVGGSPFGNGKFDTVDTSDLL